MYMLNCNKQRLWLSKKGRLTGETFYIHQMPENSRFDVDEITIQSTAMWTKLNNIEYCAQTTVLASNIEIDDVNHVIDIINHNLNKQQEVIIRLSTLKKLKLFNILSLEAKCIKVLGMYSDREDLVLLNSIIEKYMQEPDPLMRDVQGCRYELAINGFGDLN